LATLKTPQKSAILNFKEMAKLVVGFELVEWLDLKTRTDLLLMLICCNI
jgi:hypothetical protein